MRWSRASRPVIRWRIDVAIYHDFEPRNRKGLKKREAVAPIGESLTVGGNGAKEVDAVPAGVDGMRVLEEMVSVMRVCANPRMLLCV
jgi:hypothetical protein